MAASSVCDVAVTTVTVPASSRMASRNASGGDSAASTHAHFITTAWRDSMSEISSRPMFICHRDSS